MSKRVLVEMRAPRGMDSSAALSLAMAEIKVPYFEVDTAYQPVPVPTPPDMAADLVAAGEEVMIVRGTIEEGQEEALERDPRVVAVWSDPLIEALGRRRAAAPKAAAAGGPAAGGRAATESPPLALNLSPAMAPCPCPPCDCDASGTGAKGTLADVARYLGADRIWARGFRGNGIVIGICDTGVHAADVPNLIGGWTPAGGSPPGDNGAHYHGTMCATDAVGICPDAKILDIGILKSQRPGVPGDPTAGLLSDALAAYDWALNEYRRNGTPQVLSNSWGMYQKSWGPDYATNPNHPFTRKAVELIHAGILICFAAGNCGEVCPSSRCGTDNGPGKSIWGANGHPLVITVGAANIRNEWIGYTSQGPAALDPNKPNVCAPSHFRGYTSNDNGTSAATPILAGVLGLLRNAKPALRQIEAKDHLQATAFDICAPGWDANSGYGIIRAEAAFMRMMAERRFPICGVQWRGRVPARATVRWYTFNWPAYWHVAWSVVPTTPQRGAPQVSWKVQVERASGDHLTYWIAVTNLTGSDVDIEGRYCILGTS